MVRALSAALSILLMLTGCANPGASESHLAADRPQSGPTAALGRPYYHFVVLGDPHLPGLNLDAKESVIRTLNSWDDVDGVVAVGDICEDRGTEAEIVAAGKFFSKLKKPLCPLAGNHDYLYADAPGSRGNKIRGSEHSSAVKLERFAQTFGLPAIYYDRKAGPYLLVFLSTDRPDHLASMSEKQLGWLSLKLEENNHAPTLIFFHAPLKGTLHDYNRNVNSPDYFAQPSARIHEILARNPQVLLWVSGHTHTSPEEESFASPVNVYDHRVTNIHNADMNRKTIWTNSLFLYPDKIVVRTFDHRKSAWLSSLERTILRPPG